MDGPMIGMSSRYPSANELRERGGYLLAAWGIFTRRRRVFTLQQVVCLLISPTVMHRDGSFQR